MTIVGFTVACIFKGLYDGSYPPFPALFFSYLLQASVLVRAAWKQGTARLYATAELPAVESQCTRVHKELLGAELPNAEPAYAYL